MQRLFSTFPEGWPGAGLAFLRAVIAIPSVRQGIAGLMTAHAPAWAILQVIAAAAAALLLAGFWTPIAGALMAIDELALVFSYSGDRSEHLLLAAMSAALAMLGPGAWSFDARRFGRKRIQIPQR